MARKAAPTTRPQQIAEEVEANYKVLVEDSRTGIVIIQDQKIAYVNPGLCEQMGYSREEALGTSIWNYVHPDQVEELADVQRRRLAGEDVPTDRVARAITKSGEVKYFDFRANLIQYKGAPAILLNAVDITPRVNAQQALARSEREFRDLVEKTSDWVWQVDENLVYTYSSPRSRALLGYEPEEIVGKSALDLMPPEEAERVNAVFAPIAANREPFAQLENALLRKDGGSVIVETSGEPVFDEDGEFRGYRGIDRDITERKQAEELVRRTTSEMEVVFHAFPDIYFWLDEEGRIVNYHATDVAELYASPDKFLNKRFDEVLPEGAARGIALAVEEVRKTGSPAAVEYPLEMHGEVRCYEARLLRVVDHQTMVIIRNITERKRAEAALRESEKKYKNLVETTDTGYLIVDAEGRVMDANAEYVRLTGHQSLEEIRGRSVLEWTADYDLDRYAAEVRECMEKGFVRDLEIDYATPDGTIIPIEINANVIETGEGPRILTLCRDITERKQADAKLRDSSEMLQLVMNNIPQFVFWKDTNSVFLGCNEIFAQSAGLKSAADIIGRTDYDFPWGETEADSYREWDRRVMESDEPQYHISEPQRTAEGRTIWLDTNKVPLHDAEGRVVGILGTYEDITERKEAEQALQETEAKYRSLAEETMVGVYIIQDDQFIYANPRFLEILGAESEDVLGKSPLEFTAPQDRALVAENVRKRIRGDVRSITYGFRALRKDGTPVDVEVHGAVTTYRGRPAIIGSLVDNTERKRYVEALQDSEERYRHLFEHSPDMLFLVSVRTGTFVAMNPAVTQTLGYAPYDVLGKSPCEISPEFQPDGEHSKEKAEKRLAGQMGAPAQRFEWVYKRKDGTLADCEVSLVGYRFHGEDLIQAIVRDVTDRKRAEEQRRKLERDLEKQKRSFYRETILSVTDGTLDICDWSDIEPFVVRSKDSVLVNEASEVAQARRRVQGFCEEHGLQGDRQRDFIVATGEAVTNAIKHGTRGKAYVGDDEEAVWVAITDEGAGIESLILPRAVLLRGFSTKPSLGLGYSIMLEVCDRILLHTGDTGTTVVLIKQKAEPEPNLAGEYLPDTWDSIPG